MSTARNDLKSAYWHRNRPPLDGEILYEHVLEATSERVSGSIVRYGRCCASLMGHTTDRLVQEVARLGGQYAHVLDEHVDSKRDDRTNESWLQGRFSYVLYRHA